MGYINKKINLHRSENIKMKELHKCENFHRESTLIIIYMNRGRLIHKYKKVRHIIEIKELITWKSFA